MAKTEKKAPETVSEEAQPTAAAATLQAKSAMMTGVLAAMSSMTHEQMMQWFPDAMTLAADIGGDQAAQNQASLAMKPSDAVGGAIREETAALFEGEELSEDAREKFATLIEHAVDLRVSIERQALQEEFDDRLVERVAEVQEELVEKVDSYVTYAAEQWVEKNELALESAIRVERATRLVEGITSLLAECGIDVPADKVDAFESLEKKISELEKKLNEQTDELVASREVIQAGRAMDVFREVSEGLTLIETEKFKKLIEDVSVDGDIGALKKKITVIREAHFKKKLPEQKRIDEAAPASPESLVESTEPGKDIVDPRIAAYARSISRSSTKRYAR